MKIDSHQHFWRYSPTEHVWMTEEMAAIRRDFLPGDLQPLLEETGFDGCVAVQARQSLEETRWLLGLAAEHQFIRGVVGWVDLRSPDLPAQLAELAAAPKLVGVRHVVHDEPDDGFMLGDRFQGGLARLSDHGLAYDLLLFPKHLPVAVRLVSAFPDQRFVLDHIAKPAIAAGVVSPWREDLRELARHPHVSCKLSGMVTEARWREWKRDDFSRYLDIVLETFGPERVMIGSDWPVCTLSASYAATVGLVVDYVAAHASGHADAILGGNCARIYQLPWPPA